MSAENTRARPQTISPPPPAASPQNTKTKNTPNNHNSAMTASFSFDSPLLYEPNSPDALHAHEGQLRRNDSRTEELIQLLLERGDAQLAKCDSGGRNIKEQVLATGVRLILASQVWLNAIPTRKCDVVLVVPSRRKGKTAAKEGNSKGGQNADVQLPGDFGKTPSSNGPQETANGTPATDQPVSVQEPQQQKQQQQQHQQQQQRQQQQQQQHSTKEQSTAAEHEEDSVLEWILCQLRQDSRLKLESRYSTYTNSTAIHITAHTDDLLKGADQLAMRKPLKEQFGGGTKHFVYKDADCFVGVRERHFLTSQERALIVYTFLNSVRWSSGECRLPLPVVAGSSQGTTAVPGGDVGGGRKGSSFCFRDGELILPVLRRRAAVSQMFPLHNQRDLARLKRDWVRNFTHPQPLDAICDYFGEQIGMYFAWLGHYTTALAAPAVLGVAHWLVLSGRSQAADDLAIVSFAVVNILWATLYLESWKRKQAALAYRWGTLGMETDLLQEPRPEFSGTLVRSPVTGRLETYYPPWRRALFRYCISYPATAACIAVMFALMLSVFELQEWTNREFATSTYFGWLTFVPKVLLAICVSLADDAYSWLAETLNDAENYRTDEAYENNLITKTVCFQFVNSFLSLFYIAFYLGDFGRLRAQLAALLITRQVIGNFKEAILPLLIEKIKLSRLTYNATKTMDNDTFKRHLEDIKQQRRDQMMLLSPGCGPQSGDGAVSDQGGSADFFLEGDHGCLRSGKEKYGARNAQHTPVEATEASNCPITEYNENSSTTTPAGSTEPNVDVFKIHPSNSQTSNAYTPDSEYYDEPQMLLRRRHARQSPPPSESVSDERVPQLAQDITDTPDNGDCSTSNSTPLSPLSNVSSPDAKPYNPYQSNITTDAIPCQKAANGATKAQATTTATTTATTSPPTADDAGGAGPRLTQAEVESIMPRYPSPLEDYLEMYIQFGLVLLFSPAFPLAAACALVNNFLEIHVDAFKLTQAYQRPFGRRVDSIGYWQPALELLGVVGVIVNCALIGYSGVVRRFWPDLGVPGQILFVVALEHVVLALRAFLAFAIPDVPHWVTVEQSKVEYKRRAALKTVEGQVMVSRRARSESAHKTKSGKS